MPFVRLYDLRFFCFSLFPLPLVGCKTLHVFHRWTLLKGLSLFSVVVIFLFLSLLFFYFFLFLFYFIFFFFFFFFFLFFFFLFFFFCFVFYLFFFFFFFFLFLFLFHTTLFFGKSRKQVIILRFRAWLYLIFFCPINIISVISGNWQRLWRYTVQRIQQKAHFFLKEIYQLHSYMIFNMFRLSAGVCIERTGLQWLVAAFARGFHEGFSYCIDWRMRSNISKYLNWAWVENNG